MKRLMVVLLLISFVAVYGFSDATIAARQHAEVDTAKHNTAGWGFGTFGLSILLTPLIGGGLMIAASYASGEEEIPIDRLAWANGEYSDDSNSLFVYQTVYQTAATKIRHDANVNAAWGGAGMGTAISLVIALIYFTATYQPVAAAPSYSYY